MAGRFSVEAVFSAVDKVTAPVTRMQNAVGKMTRSVERSLRSVTAVTNSAVSDITSATGTIVKFGVAGFGLLAGAVALVTREFSKIENAEAFFTPLMGGAARAKALVDALNETAASTPFQFEQLADAAGQLLPAMNGDIERTIRTVRMLGDTVGGNAQKMESVTREFAQAMLTNKVGLDGLKVMAGAGVPIFTELAAVMGTKVNAAFFKMISAGKVTTKELQAAFTRMTSAGGIFYKGMEIASQTTTGLWSSFTDNAGQAAAELGRVLSPTVKEVIVLMDDVAKRVKAWIIANKDFIQLRVDTFVDRIKKSLSGFIDRLQALDAEYSILDRIADGFGKVSDAIDWLVQHGAEVLTLTKWIAGLVIGLNALVGVLTLVNIAMAANPIGLIVIGITAAIAAITAMVVYVDELLGMFEKAPLWLRVMLAPLELILRAIKLIKDNWDSIVTGGKKFAAFLGFDVAEPPPAAKSQGVDTSQFTGGVGLLAAPPAVNVAPPAVNVAPVGIAAPPTVNVATSGPTVSVAPPLVRVAPEVDVTTAAPVVNAAPPLLQSPTFGQPAANEEQQPAAAPMMVSPQERTARSIEERRTTNSAEVTIRDDTGRAEVTKGKLTNNIKMQNTGRF
jgi:tape measure domain-containing protein